MKSGIEQDQGIGKRFRSREPLFGGWTSLGHASITEAFVRSGVDWIGIDLEHSTISMEQAQAIISASQAGGLPCLPRIASHNGEMVRRLLDSGADGIIAPNVSTVSEAKQLIDWCKYPPAGKRSFGVARAHTYGFDFDAYVERWNERSVLILQIESLAGVEAAESLLDLPEVDGLMAGPYDISGSVGVPGQLNHPKVTQACAQVAQACRRAGKACGTQIVDPNAQNVQAALEGGYTFVVLASDVFLLWKWGERMRSLIQGVRQEEKV